MVKKALLRALAIFMAISCVGVTLFAEKLGAKEIVPHSTTILSEKIRIDAIHRSMQGPGRRTQVRITDKSKGKVIWLTGGKVEVQDEENNAVSGKYLCHSNLSFEDPFRRNKWMMHTHVAPGHKKFLDLNQGQPQIEFPQGFGMPFLSNEKINFDVMALNNQPLDAPLDLKFKASLNYVNEEDLEQPMKVLQQTGIDFVVRGPQPNCHNAEKNAPCGVFYEDKSGLWRNSHWLVPPGRHTFSHSLGGGMFIPYNTTAHFIAMHLHPYAESMELIDRTTGETVFKGYAYHYPNNQDIEKLESYSSAEGAPLYRDHQYEVVTVYNNVTDRTIDAMAILYIYFWDKKFDRAEIEIGTGKN